MSKLFDGGVPYLDHMSESGRFALTNAIRIIGLSFLWLVILAFQLGLPDWDAYPVFVGRLALPFIVSCCIFSFVAASISRWASKGVFVMVGAFIATFLGTFGAIEIGILSESFQLQGAVHVSAWLCIGACCTFMLTSWLCMIALSEHDIAATTIMLSLALAGVWYFALCSLQLSVAFIALSCLPFASMACFFVSLRLLNQPYDEIPGTIEKQMRPYAAKPVLASFFFGLLVGLAGHCLIVADSEGFGSRWFAGALIVAACAVFAIHIFGKSESRIAVCFQLSPVLGLVGLLPFLDPGLHFGFLAALVACGIIALGLMLIFVARLSFLYELSALKSLGFFVAMSAGGIAAGLAQGAYGGDAVSSGVLLAVVLALCFVCVLTFMNADTFVSILRGNPATDEGRHLSGWRDAVADISAKYALTPRETEIMLLLSRGKNAKTIANYFVIAEGTVKSHTYRIYKKIGAANQQDLIEIIEDAYEKKRQS